MTSPRRALAIALLAGAAASSCQGSKTTSLTCKSFASAQAMCDDLRCDPTWTAVETNHAYCSACAFNTYRAGDCGDFHVLTYTGVDFGGIYYYQRDTGALVAGQFWNPPSPTGTWPPWARRRSRPRPAATRPRSPCYRAGARPTRGRPGRRARTAAPRAESGPGERSAFHDHRLAADLDALQLI